MSEAAARNVPEYSVSEISGAVKRTLEGAFGRVRVRGEITEFKRYPSGHLYFSLKDENAKISRHRLEERRVAARAGAGERRRGDRDRADHDLWRAQLVPAHRRADGVCRRRRVAGADRDAEEAARPRRGCSATERKRRLPMLPSVVGVVTSPSGAVLHDIRTTIARRFPRPGAALAGAGAGRGRGGADRRGDRRVRRDPAGRRRCRGRTC